MSTQDHSAEGHEPAADDVKAKMRAALEKKHAHGGKDVSANGPRNANGPGRAGAVGNQKNFRRKSG